jgi:hypothetical protein
MAPAPAFPWNRGGLSAEGLATSETSLNREGCLGVYRVASDILRSSDSSWRPLSADLGNGVVVLTGSFGPGAA